MNEANAVRVFRVRRYDETGQGGGPGTVIQETILCKAYTVMGAKRLSRDILGGDPDKYVIDPVTNPGERCYLVWE